MGNVGRGWSIVEGKWTPTLSFYNKTTTNKIYWKIQPIALQVTLECDCRLTWIKNTTHNISMNVKPCGWPGDLVGLDWDCELIAEALKCYQPCKIIHSLSCLVHVSYSKYPPLEVWDCGWLGDLVGLDWDCDLIADALKCYQPGKISYLSSPFFPSYSQHLR